MTIIESLEWRADELGADAKRLRDAADQLTVDAYRKRAQADTIELDAIESRSAAHLLRQAGFRVDRTEDGVPRISVDSAPTLSSETVPDEGT